MSGSDRGSLLQAGALHRIYQFRCCIGLAGINLVVERPDLMDRSILYQLKRIPKHQRKKEEELLAEFEEARPAFFGGMLDALAVAMCLKPHLELEDLPRMADFATWGACIAPALGYSKEQFIDAYDTNRSQQNEEVLAANPVGALLLAFMKSMDRWEGSATDLLSEIRQIAEANGVSNSELPGGPNGLTRKLNRLSPNLAAAGIRATNTRTSMQRRIVLEKVAP